jgi:triosephosphate isomerase
VRLLIGTSTKMNLTSSEAASYLEILRPRLADVPDRTLFVLLPFTAIWVARERLAGSAIGWGAQDVHPDDAGAHTGDVSAPMLADLGCTYVEVGHHERRRDYGETDELVARKVAAIQRWGMTAIVCIGEQQRLPMDGVIRTLDRQLGHVGEFAPARLIVAYEPSWAIGVGATAAPTSWVRDIHAAIRDRLPAPAEASIPVIYGGSVSPDTAEDLLAEPGVDGLFVGRQALDAAVFAAIAHTPVR